MGSQSEGGAFADSAEQAAAASPVPEKAAPADIKITPRAKKVAEEQGLEYSHIQGTGLLGRNHNFRFEETWNSQEGT